MPFRLKAFAIHLAASLGALTLVLGLLYAGWYRWPGWYLTGVGRVVAIMVGVDAALGPLLTLLVANPRKPRRELARDIGMIAAVQLVAFVYGTLTLWQGRPLYYTFSERLLETVPASALTSDEIERARRENPALAPYWYSRPRWVWVPLPEDPQLRQKLMGMAMTQGQDIIDMPRYFRPWQDGLPSLRKALTTIDGVSVFTMRERQALKAEVAALGLPTDQPNALFMFGRETRLLAIFDPASGELRRLLPPPPPPRKSPPGAVPASTPATAGSAPPSSTAAPQPAR
jgi:hypothetical protein